MKPIKPYILKYYCTELTKMIAKKYGYSMMDSLRSFVHSATYKMLIDDSLEMWDFSPIGIFDMWENERITGDPRNSLYLRRDEYVG